MIAKNNLFNIRYNRNQHWLGENSQCMGFVIFERPEYSIRACLVILRSYYRQGINTIRGIVERFAPKSENDVERYVKYLCCEVGITEELELDYSNYVSLVCALAWYETHTRLYVEDVNSINMTYNILHIASTPHVSFNIGQLKPELHTDFIP